MSREADWLIVGAGISGLTLAVKLAQAGVPFSVYEQEKKGLGSGAGLLLASNATRILQKLGLLEPALEMGRPTTRWYVQSRSGAILREIRIDTEASPALSIHRADLLHLLRSRLPEDSLHMEIGVKSMRGSGCFTDLSLSDGAVVSGKALIGADGIRSVVRRHLFGDDRLLYRGYVGWRGVAPFVPEGYQDGKLSETWGPGGRFGIAPLDAKRTYWYASANREESWIDIPTERRTSLLKRYVGWHPPVADLIAATPNRDILVTRIYDVPRLRAWSRGNVTLLGDAAHAMTPNLGQGACLAIEDAWVLGSIISADFIPESAFKKYQNMRMRRAYSIQRQSRALGWIVQAESPLALAARDWVTPRIPNFALGFGMRSIFSDEII